MTVEDDKISKAFTLLNSLIKECTNTTDSVEYAEMVMQGAKKLVRMMEGEVVTVDDTPKTKKDGKKK